MAKDNRKDTAPGSVDRSSEHKVAILKALATLQDCHPKSSDLWKIIEKTKKEIEEETSEDVLKAKRAILYEEFKKEMDEALSP